MQIKILYAVLVLLFVAIGLNTWVLSEVRSLDFVSEPAAQRPNLEEPNRSKIIPKEVSTAVPQALPTPKVSQIPIYTKSDNSGVVFTTFKGRKDLLVVNKGNGWVEVVSTRGFPVWVRQDMVESFANGYVNVVVNRANARTSPGVSNSVPLGKLSAGDVLKVSKRQDEWVRVWSPIKFKAWVKLSDLNKEV